jgi:hypothetical protein
MRHAAPTLSCHAQVDLLYLHNVAEAQLARLGAEGFDAALRRAFVWLEEARQRGQIKACAPTWPCGLYVCAAWPVTARQPRACALRSVIARAALESDFLGCGLGEAPQAEAARGGCRCGRALARARTAAVQMCALMWAPGCRYGMATWDCFRLPPGAPGHLSLARVVALAEAAGGVDHGFRCGRAGRGRGGH